MSRVLIVGAGALGTVTGYHLALGGTEVTFFVRPARLAEMQPPQTLYCYDDGQLKNFLNYRVMSNMDEVRAARFDFVMVTFDGATCRSPEGTKLLTQLGDAIRATPAVIVIAGVGVLDHYVATTGLPEARLLEGTMASLSYQVARATMPLHPPTRAEELSQALLAYRQMNGKTGFMVAARPAKTARDFAEIYNRGGVSACVVLNAELFRIISTAFFPLLAVNDLAGWPDAKTMSAEHEKLELCAGAMREISRLPRHGWIGRGVALALTRPLIATLLKKMERDTLPMDFAAFNKFHHGGKVRAQDIQVMRDCANEGAGVGHRMLALNTLLLRYETHIAAG